MKFSDYLKSKRNFIIIWFAFHGFALFVTVFGITGGKFKHSTTHVIFSDFGIREELVDEPVYLLTDSDRFDKETYSNFWPFSLEFNAPNDYAYFRGVFYRYDYSEFIAYAIFIFLFYYIFWEVKIKNKKIDNTN